ncbi:peptidase domain-containing ABC transporter [Anaerosacchariphilus polymeriproducens]|uniref:Peptidase domain-containing ABC transporter n=1 Tax=Anaerosacchariphilus polymeriproducens TaxID=1812858 RepID=A0A371AQL6_9FIRM|nr:peptidase domain-containing ABC transporter [Anaerosacchariphilus polymeriproducens]RDU21857.1 peptidase domain-containing ABC transporter [Anaerosacchariphilus polymeriproducens]
MDILKKYYCVKQHDIQDCGPACLATISKQYGLKLSVSKIREAAGTDLEGTSVYGIIQAAQKLKFSTKAVRVEKKEEIFDNLPTPLIAHVIIEDVLLHFVVIQKITKKYILVADPGRGMMKYKPDNFFKIWNDVLIFLAPTAKFEKGDETKGLFQRFWGIIKIQKGLLMNIFIASILVTGLGIAGSFYYKFLIDDILPNNLEANLHSISIAMLTLLIFKIITEFFRKILLLYMAQNIDVPLLLGYYNHVIKLPMNFFGTRKVGEIISRFNDGDKIRNAISSVILTLMIDVLMTVVGGVILYLQNVKLFFTCFVPIILYLVLVFGFKKKIKKVNRKVMEDNASMTSYLVESLEGIETVKAFNGEGLVQAKTENNFFKFMRSCFKCGCTYNAQETLMNVISGGFGICLLWFGSSLVIKGEVSMGELISFNALLAYFIQPIGRLINLQPQLQEAIVASDRLGEILDLELEKSENESIQPETLAGNISLQNLSFAYGVKDNVLEDINIHISNGERIALVGESGSGKTTIARLLMGFYEVKKGKILLNNYEINEIDKETLRSKISYISQDSFFFSGTIKENLEFAGEDITYENMVDACKKAQIHDYIESLPLRYNTPLEEKGANLSGGQRQRLSIARALLKRPEILIMDEATSNLDSITERAIQRTLDECTGNVTTIMIAHRLSTIKKCHKIYVMDKGRIIEEGNHRELLYKKGYYYNLWTEQTLDYEEQKLISACN